jgi:hypothetical protein
MIEHRVFQFVLQERCGHNPDARGDCVVHTHSDTFLRSGVEHARTALLDRIPGPALVRMLRAYHHLLID